MRLTMHRRQLASAVRAHPERAPRVAIIGAGLSGLGMASQLKEAGVEDLVLFEKADGPGGTWRDNTYPGAACDVPSHLYSFSFAHKPDWSRKFAEQPEILGYVDELTERFGLGPHIRFGTEVVGAAFDEDAAEWTLTLGDGATHVADVLVAATGQLSRPSIPDVPGLETFEGTSFHSARWDHEHDLAGRSVAVVGTGASAIQFVPPVAEQAGSLTIFQRTPSYVAPKPDRPFTDQERRRFERIPLLSRLYRWSIYWRFEARFVMFRQDSRLGRRVKRMFDEGLQALVSDELPREAVIPDYPVGCKRLLISNDYYPALLRPNVRMVDEPVARIEPDAVVTDDGERHEVDTIIWGTGFQTTRFLAPVEVVGAGGMSLQREWKDGAEAHLGLTVAGFPNLFLLYGPNTNLGHNSILFMVERQIDYVLQCLRHLVTTGEAALELKPEVQQASIAEVDRRMSRTVWAAACSSWYKTATGRVTNNWPGFTVQYWRATLRPRFADYRRLTRSR